MSSTRRTYSREFKIEAAKLSYNSDKPVADIAEQLGISQSSLNWWRSEYRDDPDQAFPGKGQMKERDEEVAQLKKELIINQDKQGGQNIIPVTCCDIIG